MSSKQLLKISFAIYFMALIFPVWSVKGNNPIYGFEALLIGWLALLILDPRWLCNLVVIFSTNCVLKKFSKKYSNICFLMAALGTTAVFGPFHAGLSMGTFDLNEGTGLAIGGYLWVLSLWLFAISAYIKGKELAIENNF